jgi:hypothetical protein
MQYKDTPTKKQIRAMKALYDDAGVEVFCQAADRQVAAIQNAMANDENPEVIGQAVVAIFSLTLNETSRMLAAFDANAFEKALAAGRGFGPAGIGSDDPMTGLFARMHRASQNFAFGHAFNKMNKAMDNATAWISSFMMAHPEYQDALERAWSRLQRHRPGEPCGHDRHHRDGGRDHGQHAHHHDHACSCGRQRDA